MAEQGKETTLVLRIIQELAGKFRFHGEDQIGSMTLYQAKFFDTDNAILDGGIDIGNLPIFIGVGFKNYQFGVLIVTEFGLGTDTMGKGLAHVLVESFGGGAA